MQHWYYRPRTELRMDQADRQMVIEEYRDEIERAGEMISRDLSAWLR
ncbi:MAG: hypothetical protein HY700_19930 [Gemmatimonadetes bacterium]|nr:hypothetical protein [Gemmatimonadota bacterium]